MINLVLFVLSMFHHTTSTQQAVRYSSARHSRVDEMFLLLLEEARVGTASQHTDQTSFGSASSDHFQALVFLMYLAIIFTACAFCA